MKPGRFAQRSRWFYRREHLAFAACLVLVSAVMTGALLVGDAVRESLAKRVETRLGGIQSILMTEDRVFRSALASDLNAAGFEGVTVPVLAVQGVAVDPASRLEAPGTLILGVDDRFWQLSPGGQAPDGWDEAGGWTNEALAAALPDAGEAVIRMAKPGALSRDVAAAQTSAFRGSGRVRLEGVLSEAEFGGFGLTTDPAATPLLIMPLGELQEMLELEGRANLLLASAGEVEPALNQAWRLGDAGLEVVARASGGSELETQSVFLIETVVQAGRSAFPEAQLIYGYFVNEIAGPTGTAPYCVVAGLSPPLESPLPDPLPEDGVVINEWLAERIGAKPGDTLKWTYYVLGERRELNELQADLPVAAVVPMTGVADDRTLMPNFPGLAETESCYDWDPGLPVDLDLIQESDEAYWQAHQGTPKAFLRYETAEALFANPFGVATAMRFDAAPDEVERELRAGLSAAAVGLGFRDVRAPAEAAAKEGLDFGQLFASMSVFLVVAAACLGGLVVSLLLENRVKELGMMRAIGFTAREVRGLWLREFGLVAIGSALVGVPLGILFNWGMLNALNHLWSGATGGLRITAGYSGVSMLAAPVITLLVGALVVWLRVRARSRERVVALFGGGDLVRQGREASWLWPGLSLLVAVALLIGSGAVAVGLQASLFFGAGAALLAAGLLTLRTLWSRPVGGETKGQSLGRVAWRQARRRPGRSLALVTLLALATFLVVSVGVNRKVPPTDWAARDSGTGGFGWLAPLSVPLTIDPTDPAALEEFGFVPEEIATLNLVGLRERGGDDASCLNLARAQEPRVLGVPLEQFTGRWQFQSSPDDAGWASLECATLEGPIPCAVDASTLQWGLGKQLGDRITLTAADGTEIEIEIVAVLADSIFQGSLLIDERAFARAFPEAGGYRWLLGNLAANDVEQTRKVIGDLFRDYGPAFQTTRQRLAAFLEVQNTYLAIFEWLGGLGLLLGALGLGLITVRNLVERRSEWALLRALGFPLDQRRRLAMAEHALLAALGILGGAVAGFVPLLASRMVALPTGSPGLLALLILMVSVMAAVAIWLAVRLTLREETARLITAE